MTRYLLGESTGSCNVLSGGNPTTNAQIDTVAATSTEEDHLIIHYTGGDSCGTGSTY
jgi:hypothetical protein